MTLPSLKHVRISSQQELRNWIEKNSNLNGEFMIVTYSKKSPKKHVRTVQVRDTLERTGWSLSRSFTLNGDLVGHVVSSA